MIILAFLSLFSFSIYVGVDAGCGLTKGSIVTSPDNIEIGLNFENSPTTPTFIGFRAKPSFNMKLNNYITPDEAPLLSPEIGEKALKIMEVRPHMGMGYFPDFVELNESYKIERADQLITSLNASRVEFHDSSALFYHMFVEEISNEREVNALCFVVPAKYLHLQRYQYEIMGAFSRYQETYVIDDMDAVAYVYANDRSSSFAKKSKNILFIDIGATSVKAYALKFVNKLTPSGHSTFPLVKRKLYVINYNTGGIFVTKKICEYIQQRDNFIAKTPSEKRRLFDTCEKLKLQLGSKNEEEALFIANEIGGIDRACKLTKNELDSLLDPFADEIIPLVNEVISMNKQIDDIEVIGGGSKNDRFVDLLQRKLLNVSIPLKRSLDPLQTLSKGAGYFLQFVKGESRYQDVHIFESKSIFSITMKTAKGDKYTLCEYGKKCIQKQTIPGNSAIILFEIDSKYARNGLASYSYGYFLDEYKEPINLYFLSNPYTLLKIEHCNSTGCHDTYRYNLQLLMNPETPTKVFDMFADKNARGERKEEVIKSINELAEKVLNDVSKNKTFRFFSNHTQRLDIIRAAESAQKWIKQITNFDSIPLGNFTDKLQHLKSFSDPVYDRISANNTLVKAANMFLYTLELAKNGTQREWPKTKPYIDKRTIQKFNEMIDEMDKWFKETVQIVRKAPPYLERPITYRDYEEKTSKLFDYYTVIDSMERMKKRAGKKSNYTPTPTPSNDDTDDDDENEKHNPEYEYIDMTDEEMAAYYAEHDWEDPFRKFDEKKKKRSLNLNNYKLSREMRHFINKKSKEMEEEEESKKNQEL